MASFDCTICDRSFTADRQRYLHTMNDHTAAEREPGSYTGKTASLSRPDGRREKFSTVSSDGRCPRCGGPQFKAKRSKKGKAAGAVAGVLGILAAPKTQVRCESCGLMFKRG